MIQWQTKRLDELGKIVTGKTPASAKPEEFGDQFPFITPSDIPKTQKHVGVERLLSQKGMEAHKRILLPKKSTCVVCIGATIGKVCMTEQPSFSNQQINSIIPLEGEHDPDFIYYISTKLKDALVSFAGGAATPIVNKSVFSSIKVLVPDYEVQRKIAAILSAYDDLIENNKRRIALLEKMAEEIYREWFVRMRFPGHEHTRFLKSIPEGWSIVRIGERFDTFLGGTPSRKIASYWGGDVPWVNSGEINKSRIIQASELITDEGLRRSATKMMPKHTTVLAITGATLGQVSLTDIEVCANQSVVGVYDKYCLYNEYNFQFIKMNIENMIAKQSGGGQQHINKDIVEKEFILLPDEALVTKYNMIIHPIFNELSNLLFTNQKLVKVRDTLLGRLISGKLSVENLDIQFPPSMQEDVEIPEQERAYA